MSKNLYFVYRGKHWIILKHLNINLLKNLLSQRMPLLFLNSDFVSKEQLLFLRSVFSFQLSWYEYFYCSQYRIRDYFLPSWQSPGICFTLFGMKKNCSASDFSRNYVPGERAFFGASLKIWSCVTKFTLEINTKCQNVAAMFGAK